MIQIVYGDVELRPVIGQPGGFVRAFHGGYVDEVRDIAHRGDQAIAGERLRINHQNPKALKRRIRRIGARSEEHTSELQSLMRISYAVFCLKKKKRQSKIEGIEIHKI